MNVLTIFGIVDLGVQRVSAAHPSVGGGCVVSTTQTKTEYKYFIAHHVLRPMHSVVNSKPPFISSNINCWELCIKSSTKVTYYKRAIRLNYSDPMFTGNLHQEYRDFCIFFL
jgi:hypothetical protein